MIWMLDTNILINLTNRKPGFEKIARQNKAAFAELGEGLSIEI